jgi:hypothetical protein
MEAFFAAAVLLDVGLSSESARLALLRLESPVFFLDADRALGAAEVLVALGSAVVLAGAFRRASMTPWTAFFNLDVEAALLMQAPPSTRLCSCHD